MMKASKSVFKLFLAIIFTGAILQISACGGDDPGPGPDPNEPTAQELTTQKLTADTWVPEAILRGGVNVSAEYDGFTVNFTDTGYTTTNGGSAWPASGSWSYDGTSSTRIIRDGEVVINLTVTDVSLVMNFTLEEDVFAGRKKTVSTDYQFSMAK